MSRRAVSASRRAARLLVPGWVMVSAALTGAAEPPLHIIVMDPLAKEMACACVKGYAQRDYKALATALQQGLDQPVRLEFSDNLADSVRKPGDSRDLMVIGKSSVVQHDARATAWKCQPVARLTGVDGATTLTGLFVVKTADPARGLPDLSGRRIFFGLPNANEKHDAAFAALRAAGVDVPATLETRETCSAAVLDLLDSDASPAPAAVISSYALALLEGCGSIAKGDLKVIGKTSEVPFVSVFVADSMPATKRQKVLDLLLAVKTDAALLKALESKDGFQPWPTAQPQPKAATPAADWPGWRGPHRDGRVPCLPQRLPEKPRFVWKTACFDGGLAGLSLAGGRLIVAERDLTNRNDVVRCLDADTGALLWRVVFPAAGKLDYGESPRATPLIHDGRIYQLGAFGDMRCLALTDGALLWQRQLIREFGAKLPVWGTCSAPLLSDGLLIIQPGAPEASLAALDPATGETRWTAPGAPAAYASFIAADLGGRHQLVGYDQSSLGGWDPMSGQRLWRMEPPEAGDFNVPTPLVVDGKLIVATENNGTRMYGFDAAGHIIAEPIGSAADLAPDTATPVATRGRIFGAHHGLHCLDATRSLQPVWRFEDDQLKDHASLFASEDRVLVVTMQGELILLDAAGELCQIVSRLRVFEHEVESYAHPALAGSRLYLRGGATLACVDLGP